MTSSYFLLFVIPILALVLCKRVLASLVNCCACVRACVRIAGVRLTSVEELANYTRQHVGSLTTEQTALLKQLLGPLHPKNTATALLRLPMFQCVEEQRTCLTCRGEFKLSAGSRVWRGTQTDREIER